MRQYPIPYQTGGEDPVIGGLLTLRQLVYIVLTVGEAVAVENNKPRRRGERRRFGFAKKGCFKNNFDFIGRSVFNLPVPASGPGSRADYSIRTQHNSL